MLIVDPVNIRRLIVKAETKETIRLSAGKIGESHELIPTKLILANPEVTRAITITRTVTHRD